MFQIGEKVVYGVHGICNVVDLEERIVDRKTVVYLVLEPMGQGSARYLVPAHNSAAMAKVKKMLSREELESLMNSEAVLRDCWIADENQRKHAYREMIGSGDREKLMQMVHTLYGHKAAQAAAGKKFHLCDENFLRDVEKLLISEISCVLELDREDAKQYLRTHLNRQ